MATDDTAAREQLQAHLTSGARAGLAGPTATLPWPAAADPARDEALDRRLRQRVARLWPSDPLPYVQPADWPEAFLVEAGGDRAAQWCVALAIAIQWRARDPVGRGRVVPRPGGGCELALPWLREAVLQGAVRFAARYLRVLLEDGASGEIDQELERWLAAQQAGALAPNTVRFALAAHRRGIPVDVYEGLLWLGWGCRTQRMESSFTGATSNIATRIARIKTASLRLLRAAGIPVPAGGEVAGWEQALGQARRLGWPVVVKPANQDQGVGVVPDISDEATLRAAYDAAERLSPRQVIVEKHVAGADHRMLVMGGRLIAAARRDPAAVVGDGRHTVEQLVALENRNPLRGTGKRSLLMRLVLDDEAQQCLAKAQLAADSVPPAGTRVRLRKTANLSTGGTPVDVTDEVHPDNRLLVERAALIVGLDIAGVDFLCPDLRRSWREVGGAICEVNAQPGFRPHWVSNPERDVNGTIVDWLFADRAARIPTAAVLGGPGGRAVAHLLHLAWNGAGLRTALAAGDGGWIGPSLVLPRDATRFAPARVLLRDPMTEAAVFQLALPALQREGHACDAYDAVAWLGGAPAPADEPVVRDALRRARGALVLEAQALAWAQADPRLGQRRCLVVAPAPDDEAFGRHLAAGGEGLTMAARDGAPWIRHLDGGSARWLLPLPAEAAPEALRVRLHACALALALGIPIRPPSQEGE